MWAYAARRTLWLIPTLLGVSLVIFSLLHLAPGDAARATLPDDASEEDVQALREALGLNRPLPVQFGAWVGNLLQGDFGRSYTRKTEVRDDLLRSLRNTLLLAATSALLVFFVGSAMGTIAAFNHGRIIDKAVTALAIIGPGFPPRWAASELRSRAGRPKPKRRVRF